MQGFEAYASFSLAIAKNILNNITLHYENILYDIEVLYEECSLQHELTLQECSLGHGSTLRRMFSTTWTYITENIPNRINFR
jgi:hypothetical protein